ncbi:sugar ABC transporter permease [Halocella sp. SP3-1]|uniref:sugar ABC transporter permease n=1 Tax=Halocella sp. SP3-1 TaxID=2382161 RepID=UPI000F74EB56|nr:sugar ABC transporter permease [Halocella sp. SP3-1]AZO93173.1 sugar ABC transporter permease [Halocella sp. SP3-1]
MIKSKRIRSNIGLILSYVFLLLMIMIVIIPVFWIFTASLNQGSSLYSSTIIPENPVFTHYKELFTETRFPIWYLNSIKVGLCASLLTVILVTFTTYAFSRLKFYGRKKGLMVMLVLQMFPATMNMVALYVLLNLVGLLDTLTGLILIYAGGAVPYNTWLMKGYLDTLSRSLEEAAIIDGASRWTILWRIILPLSLPIISVIAVFSFMAPFTDFLLARLILRSPSNWTLAIGLHDFIADKFGQHFTQFAAGALLAALPVTILYLFLQNLLIGGLTKGSTKG